jgi:hypothetical protein
MAANKNKDEAVSDAQMPVVSSNFKALTPKKSKNDPDSYIFQAAPIINLLRAALVNPALRTVALKVAAAINEIEKLQKDSKDQANAFETNPSAEEIKPKLAIESLLYLLLGCTTNEDMAKTLSGTLSRILFNLLYSHGS